MTLLHFLVTPTMSATPWWPTDERLSDVGVEGSVAPDERIWTDCCCCRMPANETECRYRSYFDYPRGGLGGEFVWGGDWESEDYPTGAWYGGDWDIRCASGFGCTVKPSKKRGRPLREMMRWGA